MKTLLEYNADPNVKNDRDGCTPIHHVSDDFYAQYFQHSMHYNEKLQLQSLESNVQCMKILLKYRANSNLTCGENDTFPADFGLVDYYGSLFLNNPGFNEQFHEEYLDCRANIVKALLVEPI